MSGAGDVGGATGLALEVLDVLGELGVGLLVLLETVVPPVPSEVVLPLAGALAAGGRLGTVALLVSATAGSVLGAWLLFELGARLGTERVAGALARIPLVTREDVDDGAAWFDRHGRTAVLTGRLVPGVRSLVSVPAGARGMRRTPFLALTTIGSAAWNAALVGLGYVVGRDEQVLDTVGTVLDVALVALVLGGVGLLARRRLRER